MRAALCLIATVSLLTACATNPPEVTSSPPTVSYEIHGNDISRANISAQHYCQRYSQAPQFQGIQPTDSGNLAIYTCSGASADAALVPPPAPAPLSGSTVPPTALCADLMHQDRPGGTDYDGPPVPGCPSRH